MGLLLAIDPATNCGFALFDERGQRVASGTWDLSQAKHEGGGMRYRRFEQRLDELLDEYEIGQVAYELVQRHKGTDAAHIYGGLIAILTKWAEGWQFPYQGIPVGFVKKTATGKGNATKEEMVSAANAAWSPHTVVDDNEADALFVGIAARHRGAQ